MVPFLCQLEKVIETVVPFLRSERVNKLRKLLVEDVTLAFSDFEKEFILEVDACKTGFGAVLYQKDDDLKKRPLC